MAPQRRERIEPTDDWQQLALRVESAGQRTYELIRPVVLVGHSPAARWGQETLARRWAELIARAFMHRDGEEPVTDEELADTLAFLDYTMARLTASAGRP